MATQWSFGEAFLNQMTERRRLDQQRDQYIQDMAYKNRQQSFNQMYQNKMIENMNQDNIRQDAQLGETKRYHDYIINKPEAQQTEGSYENPKTGTVWKWNETLQKGIDTEIPYDRNKGGSGSGNNEGIYFDLTKSDKAFQEYNKFSPDNLTAMPRENSGDTDYFYPKDEPYKLENGSPIAPKVYNKDQIQTIKGQKIKELENLTDTEARKINEKVPGFFLEFQGLLKELNGNPGKIDATVNRDYKGVPSEISDAMKNLLRKRIFK